MKTVPNLAEQGLQIEDESQVAALEAWVEGFRNRDASKPLLVITGKGSQRLARLIAEAGGDDERLDEPAAFQESWALSAGAELVIQSGDYPVGCDDAREEWGKLFTAAIEPTKPTWGIVTSERLSIQLPDAAEAVAVRVHLVEAD